MTEPLRVGLLLKEQPVELLLDGEVRIGILREMTGKQRDAYLNEISLRMRTGPDGKSQGVKNFDGLQAGLIARCLRMSDGSQVSVKDIQEWPSSAQSTLFEACQRLNGLEVEPEGASKND